MTAGPSCAAFYRNPASDPSIPNGTNFFPQAQTSPNVCYTDVRCPRVVVVPFIADTWTTLNGRAELFPSAFVIAWREQMAEETTGKEEDNAGCSA